MILGVRPALAFNTTDTTNAPMHEGTIKTIVVGRGFGFICQSAGEPDIFFHQADLIDGLAFDETLCERRVVFDIQQERRGPRARRVRPAD